MANFTPAEDETFQIGKVQFYRKGTDVTIIAFVATWFGRAVLAGQELEKRGISVELINMQYPLNHWTKMLFYNRVKKQGCVVTAEEHQQAGGLGESAW